MFVILSGSSGVGKNTVIKEMQKANSNMVLMPTYTTRERREGEIEGLPYFYISKDEFQDKIKNGEFIEHEHIHGNFYGSSYKIFDEYIKNGKILIKDIGVEGAQNLSKKMKDKTNIVKIFLTVKHKSELKKRLKSRGEKQIKLRLKRFGYEQKQKNKFDYIVYNGDLQQTSDNIVKIIGLKHDDFYFSKKLNKLNKYKVKYYINKLTSGKILSPVKIAILGGKVCVVRGVEKLVASFVCKKPVAKLVINKKLNADKYCNRFNKDGLKS